jgi:flagellar basal body-associated protein FliL
MASKPQAPAPAKGKRKLLPLLLVCGLLAGGAGAALPWLLPHKKTGAVAAEGPPKPTGKQAYSPFGEVVVNLNEERLTRYLRVKLLLVVDTVHEKEVAELVEKRRPKLKNWLIGYLSDRSLQDVSGATGVNRLRREIWREFNAELFPDGSEKIMDIFFEEFVVQ